MGLPKVKFSLPGRYGHCKMNKRLHTATYKVQQKACVYFFIDTKHDRPILKHHFLSGSIGRYCGA